MNWFLIFGTRFLLRIVFCACFFSPTYGAGTNICSCGGRRDSAAPWWDSMRLNSHCTPRCCPACWGGGRRRPWGLRHTPPGSGSAPGSSSRWCRSVWGRGERRVKTWREEQKVVYLRGEGLNFEGFCFRFNNCKPLSRGFHCVNTCFLAHSHPLHANRAKNKDANQWQNNPPRTSSGRVTLTLLSSLWCHGGRRSCNRRWARRGRWCRCSPLRNVSAAPPAGNSTVLHEEKQHSVIRPSSLHLVLLEIISQTTRTSFHEH